MRNAMDFHQLILLLTDRCNLRCDYCYQTRRTGRRMPRVTIRAAIDLACRSTRPEVRLVFTGGEPLLEFATLRWAIAYASSRESAEKRFTYGLITNGTRLTPAVQDFLVAHDVELQLSFDGVRAAQDLRGPGTFDVLHRRLTELRERHPGFFGRRLRVAITLTPAVVPALSGSVGYLLAQEIREIDVTTSITDPGICSAACEAELERQIGAIHRMMIAHHRRTGRVPLTCMRSGAATRAPAGTARNAANGSAIEDTPTCGFAHAASPVVDPAGRLHACAAIIDSVQALEGPLFEALRDIRLGDVQDPELPERLRRFRRLASRLELFGGRSQKRSRGGRCAECRHRSGCSICPVAIGHIPGNRDPHRIPEFACAFNRITGHYRERLASATTGPATPRDVTPPDPARIPESLESLRTFAARWQDRRTT